MPTPVRLWCQGAHFIFRVLRQIHDQVGSLNSVHPGATSVCSRSVTFFRSSERLGCRLGSAGMWAWIRRRAAPPPVVLTDDGSFVVLAESCDPAASDQAVLQRVEDAGASLSGPVLLRHLCALPREAIDAVAAQLLVEGYTVQEVDPPSERSTDPDMGDLHADRTVIASGLLIAQERARTASLVTRHGGEVHGWQILAPPHDEGDLAGYDQGVL
jgi:type IV secretory pathway protease TraF